MNEVIDSRAFPEFCGIDSPHQVPDGDTIGRFRNLLEKHGIQEKIFVKVVETLTERGLILKRGTIVNSTLISALTSTKNKEKKRYPDVHSTRKRNQYYFEFKAHIGVDMDTGLVHTVKAIAANVHDAVMTSQLLHGEEKVVSGDSGYLGAQKREDAILINKNGQEIEYAKIAV